MRRIGLAVAAAALFGTPSALAAGPGGEIDWHTNLVKALEEAKREGKPVFVAIVADRVDGERRVEPAGKELRENTYPHPDVVAKSREFVCVRLKDPIDSDNGGELRSRYGIDGLIVSPQHLFIHSDGSLIRRKEYWEFSGSTKTSVDALLGFMDEALAAHRKRAGITPGTAPTPPPPTPAPAAPDPAPPAPPPTPAPGTPPAPADRAEWIRSMIERVRTPGDVEGRGAAAKELAAADKNGDCVEPLCAYLLETRAAKKQEAVQVAVIRALGRPGVEIAVPAVLEFLDDKDVEVRSNAVVTLEYIGSSKAVEALVKRLPREKEDAVHENLCRALGRSGAGFEEVRKLLFKEVAAARSERAVVGPLFGLAYFEKDVEAARALEKLIKKQGTGIKRGVMLWTLAEIGDPKSASFVTEELMPSESDNRALVYMRNIANHLSEPSDDTRLKINGALGAIFGWRNDISWDSARKGRAGVGFEPKGDFVGVGGERPPPRPGG
jgi:hypothetical protein